MTPGVRTTQASAAVLAAPEKGGEPRRGVGDKRLVVVGSDKTPVGVAIGRL